MRNRICKDGSEWLQSEMKAFLSGKLQDNNKILSNQQQATVNRKMAFASRINTVVLGTFRSVRKHLPKKLRVKITSKIKKY